MPKFIDTHGMGKLSPETLKKLQHAPRDEFGVTHHDILYNETTDKVFCVLEAPNADAVRKHHQHAGIECEWVQEIESTRG
jgi:hypothetical protein